MTVETTGYSIWLEPSGRYKADVDNIIREFAHRFNSPVFGAHVTLIGGINGQEQVIVDRTTELAKQLSSFGVSLSQQIICEDNWTRSLAVRARKTSGLLKANGRARKMFDLQAQAPFDPHMSFLYVENIPVQERLQVADQLFGGRVLGTNFSVTSLQLYHCEGLVKDWQQVAVIPLTS